MSHLKLQSLPPSAQATALSLQGHTLNQTNPWHGGKMATFPQFHLAISTLCDRASVYNTRASSADTSAAHWAQPVTAASCLQEQKSSAYIKSRIKVTRQGWILGCFFFFCDPHRIPHFLDPETRSLMPSRSMSSYQREGGDRKSSQQLKVCHPHLPGLLWGSRNWQTKK